MSKNMDDLRWIRVFTPSHIPHYLIEQVRDRDYSIEDFFKYHEINCLVNSQNGINLNPFNHLYVLADPKNEVKGVLWFNVDPLAKDIMIQTYSVDKEYWNNGQAVKKLFNHIQDILKKAHLNRVFWANAYPKHAERYGFKRSKMILMEYNPKIEIEKEKELCEKTEKNDKTEKEEKKPKKIKGEKC